MINQTLNTLTPVNTRANGMNPWLGRTRMNPRSELRLFCFPYAGGGTLTYRGWEDGLPRTLEVHRVQLPGRDGRLREPAYRRMSDLVPILARALFPYLDKPFAFFGHSMGAIIAFELARQVRRDYNLLPVHLFVSGRPAAQVASTRPHTYDLSDAEFIDDIKRLNGMTKEVLESAELMQLMLPLLRADFELIQTYSYTDDAPLNCPISAFGGLQDAEVSLEDIEKWRQQTTASFSMRIFAGDHFFLNIVRPALLRSISDELKMN